jgi:hypothetical protein
VDHDVQAAQAAASGRLHCAGRAGARLGGDGFEGNPAIVLTVTVKMLPSASGTFDFNQFDYSARAADGTTLDMAVVDNGPPELNSGTLAPGQSAKGAIMYDLGGASSHGVTVTCAPGLSTLAFWTVS